jgi:putative membrane protein
MDRRNVMTALAGASLISSDSAEAAPRGGRETEALGGGEFAMQTSGLALRRARHPRLRKFARLETSEQLAYAAALGARHGGVPLRPYQKALLRLSETPAGPAFDRAYLRGQILGHRELLRINRSLASGGRGIVRSVATVAVPAIETHLAILRIMGKA